MLATIVLSREYGKVRLRIKLNRVNENISYS